MAYLITTKEKPKTQIIQGHSTVSSRQSLNQEKERNSLKHPFFATDETTNFDLDNKFRHQNSYPNPNQVSIKHLSQTILTTRQITFLHMVSIMVHE
ncbi:hypothetical protein YC2023_086869 [Brassica napus]